MKKYATQTVYIPEQYIPMLEKIQHEANKTKISVNVFLLNLISMGLKQYNNGK